MTKSLHKQRENQPWKQYCPDNFNIVGTYKILLPEQDLCHGTQTTKTTPLVYIYYNSPENCVAIGKVIAQKLTSFCRGQIGRIEKKKLYIFCDNERINKLPKSEQIKEIDSLIFSAMNQQLPKRKTLSKNIKKVYDIYEQLKSLTEQAQTAENELISHVGIFTKNTQQFFSTVDKDKTQKIEEAKSNNIGNPRKFKEDVSPLTQAEQKAKNECRESYNNIQTCIAKIRQVDKKSEKLVAEINEILNNLTEEDKEYEEDYKDERDATITPVIMAIKKGVSKLEESAITQIAITYDTIIQRDKDFNSFVRRMEDASSDTPKSTTSKPQSYGQ